MILVFGGMLWMAKDEVERGAESGFASIQQAVDALAAEDYATARQEFASAEASFAQAEAALPLGSRPLLRSTRYVPGLSGGASAVSALEAGRHIAKAGPALVDVADGVHSSRRAYETGGTVSLLSFFADLKKPLTLARTELGAAEAALRSVALDDVPAEKQAPFLRAKEQLPALLGMMDSLESHETILAELLGQNGPRKYLFLLQNNHELRPTGGFIGTYALLSVNDGIVKQFFVDGIFNPDGQLRENIVPPKPLQKVSAGWSLHDSNWFADFPTSAEKAIFFYEKTGGPTVDGVITLTPTVMQQLLKLTGPIDLPQYGLTVDSENFIPVIQEQVEEKYDKEENKPKQVLADLSTLLLERVFSLKDERMLYDMAEALIQGLNEKHILLYSRNAQAENLIDKAGWSGRLQETDKDFLSVVHSNVNGYKTDGVIDETIRHRGEIAEDGSVIDTVTITRVHKGGHTPYDWWNRVNADYLRVYVPEGSELLSAKGMTWEFPEAPLDYARLGFRKDSLVEEMEAGERVDEATGTRISRESGKTVFGNWVYVSPQESVTVEYRYRLPFKVRREGRADRGGAYSVIYQKQAGSLGSALSSVIQYPPGWKPIWQTGANLVPYEHILKLDTDLVTDKFVGVAFDVEAQ